MHMVLKSPCELAAVVGSATRTRATAFCAATIPVLTLASALSTVWMKSKCFGRMARRRSTPGQPWIMSWCSAREKDKRRFGTENNDQHLEEAFAEARHKWAEIPAVVRRRPPRGLL